MAEGREHYLVKNELLGSFGATECHGASRMRWLGGGQMAPACLSFSTSVSASVMPPVLGGWGLVPGFQPWL